LSLFLFLINGSGLAAAQSICRRFVCDLPYEYQSSVMFLICAVPTLHTIFAVRSTRVRKFACRK